MCCFCQRGHPSPDGHNLLSVSRSFSFPSPDLFCHNPKQARCQSQGCWRQPNKCDSCHPVRGRGPGVPGCCATPPKWLPLRQRCQSPSFPQLHPPQGMQHFAASKRWRHRQQRHQVPANRTKKGKRNLQPSLLDKYSRGQERSGKSPWSLRCTLTENTRAAPGRVRLAGFPVRRIWWHFLFI